MTNKNWRVPQKSTNFEVFFYMFVWLFLWKVSDSHQYANEEIKYWWWILFYIHRCFQFAYLLILFAYLFSHFYYCCKFLCKTYLNMIIQLLNFDEYFFLAVVGSTGKKSFIGISADNFRLFQLKLFLSSRCYFHYIEWNEVNKKSLKL